MSKTKTETPVLRNSADIPWEENRPRHKVDKRIYVLLTVFSGLVRCTPLSGAPLETGHLLPACRLDRSRPCICSG